MTDATASTGSKKWDEAKVAQLNQLVAGQSPVPGSVVESAATALGFSVRSIAAKLRNLGIAVESMAHEKASAFSAEETDNLKAFLAANNGTLTYKEIAEHFASGKFGAKQIQGKILALELTGSVKATEKVEAPKQYTTDEEATFVKMANSGAHIEDIATALNKSIASVRGKALSLSRNGDIKAIPSQKVSHAKEEVDPIAALGDMSKMTVADIVKATGKTDRGVRTLLTRRGINVADYKGADKRAKADAKVKGTTEAKAA